MVAVDLPCDDDAAGLTDYADAVVDAIGDRTDLVLVAQSLAGFTAPLVCERVPVDLLVLVAAMVPTSGESPGEWWAATGHEEARRRHAERDGRSAREDDDLFGMFLHDLPPGLAAEAMTRARNPSGTPFEEPWPLQNWAGCGDEGPAVSRRPLLPGRLHARRRTGTPGHGADEMDGGHLPALARPKELAARLDAYRREWESRPSMKPLPRTAAQSPNSNMSLRNDRFFLPLYGGRPQSRSSS